MIEALHLGPWLDEMERRDRNQVTAAINLLDCGDCKRRNRKETRQMFGCGHESPIEGAVPWAPTGYLAIAPRDDKGKAIRPKTCIGFTRLIKLVGETTWDVLHWDQGSLGLVYDDISDEQWDRMKLVKVARAHAERWSLDNPPKKPGEA